MKKLLPLRTPIVEIDPQSEFKFYIFNLQYLLATTEDGRIYILKIQDFLSNPEQNWNLVYDGRGKIKNIIRFKINTTSSILLIDSTDFELFLQLYPNAKLPPNTEEFAFNYLLNLEGTELKPRPLYFPSVYHIEGYVVPELPDVNLLKSIYQSNNVQIELYTYSDESSDGIVIVRLRKGFNPDLHFIPKSKFTKTKSKFTRGYPEYVNVYPEYVNVDQDLFLHIEYLFDTEQLIISNDEGFSPIGLTGIYDFSTQKIKPLPIINSANGYALLASGEIYNVVQNNYIHYSQLQNLPEDHFIIPLKFTTNDQSYWLKFKYRNDNNNNNNNGYIRPVQIMLLPSGKIWNLPENMIETNIGNNSLILTNNLSETMFANYFIISYIFRYIFNLSNNNSIYNVFNNNVFNNYWKYDTNICMDRLLLYNTKNIICINPQEDDVYIKPQIILPLLRNASVSENGLIIANMHPMPPLYVQETIESTDPYQQPSQVYTRMIDRSQDRSNSLKFFLANKLRIDRISTYLEEIQQKVKPLIIAMNVPGKSTAQLTLNLQEMILNESLMNEMYFE